ncbi:MAG: prepilin-type N-terminal cleavage/methylation domain-containing protein [Candidatus Omnitrophica bacterium]|nr:prepilin-type N-terminal cleavage/methylation domain-containing protein [Candidatus Omnitrophota bacterium]
MREQGFTLLELLIVIIIICILAVLLFPSLMASKEAALNSEARANLKLIQSAEKVYRMHIGGYYYNDSIADINDNLKLYLKTSDTSWNYSITTFGINDFQANAQRNATSATYNRILWINSTLPEAECPAGSFCK